MFNCKSKYVDKMECINCGWTHNNPNIKRNCPTSIPAKPTTIQKLTNFSSAVIRDVTTGMQRCTDEEMDARLEICQGNPEKDIERCPFYNESDSSCLKCGCQLSRKRIYLNKIAWKSESCPDNPPRWTKLTE